jgi:hypothetical protein
MLSFSDSNSDIESEVNDNPHNFVFGHEINTFKKTRKQRMLDEKESGIAPEKRSFKLKRREKRGGAGGG